MEVFGIRSESLRNLAQLFCRDGSLDFILNLVASTFIVVPIFRKIAKCRLLGNGSRVFLSSFKFCADRCDSGLRVLRTNVLRIDFPQCRMLFDRAIHQRLGNGGIIYFTVAVTPIADQVHNYVATEGTAVFKGHAADAHHRIHIFPVDVEDGNRLSPHDLCGKARRM